MVDFIYNDQGACVARIVDGEVFSDADNRLIATSREGKIYALSGELVGHLQVAGLVPKDGDGTPDAFTRLLREGLMHRPSGPEVMKRPKYTHKANLAVSENQKEAISAYCPNPTVFSGYVFCRFWGYFDQLRSSVGNQADPRYAKSTISNLVEIAGALYKSFQICPLMCIRWAFHYFGPIQA